MAQSEFFIGYSINRNIVECKVVYAGFQALFVTVLIETLWNVKLPNTVVAVIGSLVLIETLWNVKESQNVESVYMDHRINRNIVECKAACILPLMAFAYIVLIETLWNVKMTCGAAMVFHLLY